MRSAVGPEPRSKAEPIALGAVAGSEALDWRLRGGPELLIRVENALLSLPVFLIALAVRFGMTACEVEPLVFELLPPVGFPPPPVGTHSL